MIAVGDLVYVHGRGYMQCYVPHAQCPHEINHGQEPWQPAKVIAVGNVVGWQRNGWPVIDVVMDDGVKHEAVHAAGFVQEV
ncbi:MAG: hypothetical protein JW936_10535 [Sedimentisphaerales bacterium]|nr:hypothetical protein [Sedimentisphaerales bacterium]